MAFVEVPQIQAVTVHQVARMFQVDTKTVDRWAEQDMIRVIKVNRQKIILLTDLLFFLRLHSTGAVDADSPWDGLRQIEALIENGVPPVGAEPEPPA